MAFTVKFTHEEDKRFEGADDSYSIDSSGVLHLRYAETTKGLGQIQTANRALSPQAWLEVTETRPGSPVSPIARTNHNPGRPF